MTNPFKKNANPIALAASLAPLAVFPQQTSKQIVCVLQTDLGTMAF